MCRLTEGILKQFGFTKAEHHVMLCHDWLSSRHVTIGTKAGKVLLLEDAELKQTIDVSSLIESADLSVTNGNLLVLTNYLCMYICSNIFIFVLYMLFYVHEVVCLNVCVREKTQF